MENEIQSKQWKKRLIGKVHAAFSLVELLAVIAVIGIIAVIAIPNIAGITAQADTAKAQRNAQSLASPSHPLGRPEMRMSSPPKSSPRPGSSPGSTVPALSSPPSSRSLASAPLIKP